MTKAELETENTRLKDELKQALDDLIRNSKPEVPSDNESIAGLLYGCYCQAVGGKAFNGDDLPTWEDFAADAEKTKQADAWRAVATAASGMLRNATASTAGTQGQSPVSDQPPMEPDKGDMTPDVVRWRLKNWALIEVQQHYAGREHHLPEDLRAALKGGA